MKQAWRRGVDAFQGFRKSRPKEFHWSIYGMAIGALIGFFVGGVGVAALGSAVGVPALIILAVVGGMIGNRVGVEKDKAAALGH